jgi:hypothetical protein
MHKFFRQGVVNFYLQYTMLFCAKIVFLLFTGRMYHLEMRVIVNRFNFKFKHWLDSATHVKVTNNAVFTTYVLYAKYTFLYSCTREEFGKCLGDSDR